MDATYIVIMAGGSGTRFWPASRARLPKQFLSITGPRPMIEETYRRVAPLVEDSHIVIVTHRAYEPRVREIFKDRAVRVVVEPEGRNTAPCIGLAAWHIKREADDAVLIAVPSDHFIADDEAFRKALHAAATLVRSGGIATLGIPPTRPETGYGYILKGAECGTVLGQTVYRARRFVEKPDVETAHRYVISRQYLWNSGMFAFTVSTILREIEKHLPRLAEALVRLDESARCGTYEQTLEEVYHQVEAISLDYGIMEKTQEPIYVLPVTFGWNDVGSWQALHQLRAHEQDAERNLTVGEALLIDVRESLIYSQTGRLIAVLGLDRVMIVDTPDVLLVGDLARSQDVRQFPERLKREGREELC
jgi:mannose-1-phosphate guanylyltransferase